MLEDISRLEPSDPLVELSVVSPVYGCGGCVEQLVAEVELAAREITDAFELILVDDGSPDGAWESIAVLAAARPWLVGLRLSRNFGQHAAISAGISQARGAWTVVMDCDLQDPPAAIPDLYRMAQEEHVDVVLAQRADRQDSFAKRMGSALFYVILGWLTGVRQDRQVANFGIYSRKVISAVSAMPERARAFPLMVKWVGLPTAVMPVEHAQRASGKTSYTLGGLLRLATNIALSYSDKPLRLVAGGGLICGIIAILFAFAATAAFVQGEITVAGFTSIIASTWLIGGFVMFSLGVVGLYVGQVFQNVQGRPTAIISETTVRPTRRS